MVKLVDISSSDPNPVKQAEAREELLRRIAYIERTNSEFWVYYHALKHLLFKAQKVDSGLSPHSDANTIAGVVWGLLDQLERASKEARAKRLEARRTPK